MLRNGYGNDLAGVIQFNGNLERSKTGHIIGFSSSAAGNFGSDFGQCLIDGVAGQRGAGPDINLCGGNILSDKCIKDGLVSNQIRTETFGLLVCGNGNRDNFSVAIDIHIDIESIKSLNGSGMGGHRNFFRFALAAVCRVVSSKDGILIAHGRRNAQNIL